MALSSVTRSVPGLTGVSLRGFGDLTIEQKPEAEGRETIAIEADPTILDRVLTEVRGGTLVIGFSMPWYEWLTWWLQWIFVADKRIRFRLTAARIESVHISGAGRVTVPSLRCNQLDVGISGAGKIVVSDIAATEVQTRVSGAGNIELTGAASRLEARISGAGNIRAEDLSTRRTIASISGSGRLTANATEELDAHISGAGGVGYRGNPKVIQRVSGAGKVWAIR
ncbi:MAG TPA: head GIN domain-containing protein [Spirochaetia bacterium]|nr:head GIN domain-containing protein [Spirochaetia bacterium]